MACWKHIWQRGSTGVEVARAITKCAKAHQRSKQSAQLRCRRMRHCRVSGQRVNLAELSVLQEGAWLEIFADQELIFDMTLDS